MVKSKMSMSKREETSKSFSENEEKLPESKKKPRIDGTYSIFPTLFTEKKYKVIYGTGILISVVTVVFVALALSHEMAGLFVARPFDVIVFIFVFCFLIVFGILLYPLLAIHFRERILFEEKVKNLLRTYQEANGELIEETNENGWEKAWDKVSSKYPDFAYLYTVLDQHFEFSKKTTDENQTLVQKRQDFLRRLVRATAEESIEDSTYGIRSYELPLVFCMLSVAIGFFVFSLVPFLGIDQIVFGKSSINLTWAAGGFVGAYLYSLYPLFQRYTRRDLPPRAFLDYAVRVFLGTIAITVFGNLLLLDYGAEMQFAIAAVLGSVPFIVLSQVRAKVFSKIGWLGRTDTVGSNDVSTISGITHEYSMRLHEEGVMNVQQLAFANSENLSEHTMFNVKAVTDWKDEAILQLLTGNILLKRFVNTAGAKETLYCALTKVGINTVSDLSNILDCKEESSDEDQIVKKGQNLTNLVKLLGWDEGKEEFKYMLNKICCRGVELLREVEPSVTIAVKKEMHAPSELMGPGKTIRSS